MYKSLFIIFLVLISNYSFTQHCSFDHANMIVVKIFDSKGKAVNKNLKLSLVDSQGKPLKTKNRYYKNQPLKNSKHLSFSRNLTHKFGKISKQHEFIDTAYILMIHQRVINEIELSAPQLKIKNLKNNSSIFIPITTNNYMSMCTGGRLRSNVDYRDENTIKIVLPQRI